MKKVVFIGICLIISLLVYPKNINKDKPQLSSISAIISPTLSATASPTPSPFPTAHLINTSFIPQAPFADWSQPWQDACEEASLLTVSYYYLQKNPDLNTIRNDLLSMINYETNQGWGNSINLDQMTIIATNYLKLSSYIIDNPSVSQLKNYLVQNKPIIVPAAGKILFKENAHFKSGGPFYHSLVILGFDDSQQQFIVHDVGTKFGAYYRYSYNLLMESIHDLPDSGNVNEINTGLKKALILQKLI